MNSETSISNDNPSPTETLVTTPGLLARIAKRRGVRQFVKFGIVGSSGLLVNLVIYALLRQTVSVGMRLPLDSLFYSIGFLSGGVSNYFLNRMWTFRSTDASFVQGVKFLTVSAIALVVGLVVKAMLLPRLGASHAYVSWFLATVSGIVVNFFINKYWTFNEGRSPAP